MSDPKNENPGALAGATGAFDIREWFARIDHNLKQERQASDLARAVANYDPGDRVPHLIGILELLLPGFADAFMVRSMQDARWLMECLTYRQKKAIALAAYESLPEADQQSFTAHITGVRNV